DVGSLTQKPDPALDPVPCGCPLQLLEVVSFRGALGPPCKPASPPGHIPHSRQRFEVKALALPRFHPAHLDDHDRILWSFQFSPEIRSVGREAATSWFRNRGINDLERHIGLSLRQELGGVPAMAY